MHQRDHAVLLLDVAFQHLGVKDKHDITLVGADSQALVMVAQAPQLQDG